MLGRCLSLVAVMLAGGASAVLPPVLPAQAPPPASAPTPAARVLGTVTSIGQDSLQIKPDKADSGGNAVTVVLDATTRVVRLPPGSTDLKTAEPAQVADIAVGDRVLAVGAAGSTPEPFNARRIVLMKSAAIAERNQSAEAEWKQGGGGIVVSVDPAQNSLVITAGARRVTVHTSDKTLFRRYSPGSVRFADAAKSTLSAIRPADQLRVRGERSPDESSIEAVEVVSGTFQHVSGIILSIDGAARQLTLKDLRTKRTFTVEFPESSTIRMLPSEVAERLAARTRPKGEGQAGGSAAGRPASAGAPAEEHAHRGEDLNQVIAGLPDTPSSDLHKGAAVMIVGMPKEGGADRIVAVTLLAGVEPILAANPNGESDATLSPWNLGGAPEGGS